jgi:cytochrome bd-type quinol oxidase subunit 2
MTTAQIIITTLLLIGYLICVICRKYRGEIFNFYSTMEMFIVALLVFLCYTLCVSLNKYQKGYKCPELEKIENVYKIKE